MNIEQLKTNSCRNDALAKVALAFVYWMDNQGLLRTCINCDYWSTKQDWCDKYKAKPPGTVIVTGCNAHTDYIPF
jgi:hypothetical protein